ncbi:MAG: glutaredoxin 3 [Thiohalomonadales bacterium]
MLLSKVRNRYMDKAHKKVEVYSTALCPYCLRAINLLESKGIDYVIYPVDKKLHLREEMELRSQRTSVPQIFIEGIHIGGYDEMAGLDRGNELDALLGLKAN